MRYKGDSFTERNHCLLIVLTVNENNNNIILYDVPLYCKHTSNNSVPI